MRRDDLRETIKSIASRRMLVAGLMGFSSGLPFVLTGTLLQAWLTERGTSIQIIGLFALVGLPYTFKFVWAPIFDRYHMRFLGRRRGWLLSIQVVLTAAIILTGFIGVPDANRVFSLNPSIALGNAPGEYAVLSSLPVIMSGYITSLGELLPRLMLIGIAAVLVAFFSASQDTLIDAYRRESLYDKEQGLGASVYIWGYRLAMLFTGGGGLILASHMPFQDVFYIMAVAMLIGIASSLIAREPATTAFAPTSLMEAIVSPLAEFFQTRHRPALILCFILLYKLGDSMAASLSTAYFLRLGYTTEMLGVIAKLFGFWAIIAGAIVGGLLILRLGIMRALFCFGILQGASTAAFSWLYYTGPSAHWLALVISLENFAGGMGTAAFVGYMALLTNRRFTATQYALLSSLMGVPRVIISSFTGFIQAAIGWPMFFFLCAIVAIPGLLCIRFLKNPQHKAETTGYPV